MHTRYAPLTLVTLASLAITPQAAWALPPPDVLVNAWQSIALGAGVVLGSLAALLGICRDWLKAHRPVAQCLGICGLMSITLLILWSVGPNDPSDKKRPTPVEIDVADWGTEQTIQQIVDAEPDATTREFKQKLVIRMVATLEEYRKTHGLPEPKWIPLRSITPAELHNAITNQRDALWIVDVRDDLERAHLRVPLEAVVHYGNLANFIDPTFPRIDKSFSTAIREFVGSSLGPCFSKWGTTTRLFYAMVSSAGSTMVFRMRETIGFRSSREPTCFFPMLWSTTQRS